MNGLSIVLALGLLIALIFYFVESGKRKQLTTDLASRTRDLTAAKEETRRIKTAAETAVTEARKLVDQQLADISAEGDRLRAHYEAEARQVKIESDAVLSNALAQLASLSQYQDLMEEEGAATRLLTEAIAEAELLRRRAAELVESATRAADGDRAAATKRAKEAQRQADAALDHATREAARIIAEAHQRAQGIAGDAYTALREKEQLDAAVVAIRNVIDGYGDRYVIPTRSVLDELAEEFGHTAAGQALETARGQSRRLVEEGHAADCDYAEQNRRETAIRFVTMAFNGRVDAILSRVRHDNFGTLSQEIRDAFALVNQDGEAFRNARVLPTYLDARLAELKWAVVSQELRLKEREEQRRLKEQIREEEKARREYERVIEETQREERAIEKALQQAREEASRASAEQRTALEQRIAELNDKLQEAEAKNQRALSMAQQTKKGTIYIISNVGSFGDEVFKIGMTRRLEPMDRVKELGDASVPFEFDVHALISSDDAPAMEARLHREFDELRLNKINSRKEFFRVPLQRLRDQLVAAGIDTSFTMLAEAREFRETQALERMEPEERARYFAASS
jgi:hypothetical protein